MSKTLPREIIKWIQSLDLSYSYKDSRRDLNNGFLIAEIFTRYYPHQLSMHSFDNSENTTKKNNNWFLLGKFFQKHQIPFEAKDYSQIKESNFEQLVTFMMKLYSFLTKRSASSNPYGVSQDLQLPHADEKTETYLLTNKGMEKLDVAKELPQTAQSPSNQASKLAGSKKKQGRDQSPAGTKDDKKEFRERELAKVDQRKASLLDQANEQKNEPGLSDQLSGIGGILNEMIKETLEEDLQAEDELMGQARDRKILEDVDFVDNPLAHQLFAERINEISPQTMEIFLEHLDFHIDKLSQVLLKGLGNDLWKFMQFMLTCIERLDVEKPQFYQFKAIFEAYCEKLLEKEKEKFIAFFRDLFMPKYIESVKSAEHYQKREALIELLFAFFPNEPAAKHEAIRLYKDRLNDMAIFIQSLAILINYEKETSNQPPPKDPKLDKATLKEQQEDTKIMLRDYKFYAKLAIKDKRPHIRLSGLLLMKKILVLDYDWVQKVMVRYFDCVSPDDYWENKIMIVIVYTGLLSKLSETDLYQKHIKMKPSEMAKVVSVENEMMVKVMKDVFDQISLVLGKLLKKNLCPDLSRIAMIHLANVMAESKTLVGIFLDLLLKADPALRDWILYSGEDPESKEIKERYIIQTKTSLCYECTLDLDLLKKSCSDLLAELSTRMRVISKKDFGLNHLEVLVYCFSNIDFQKLNVEVFDALINNSMDHILGGMLNATLCEKSGQILERYIENYLREEVLIQDLEKRIAEIINQCFNGTGLPAEHLEVCKDNMKLFLDQLKREYTPDKALYERFMKMIGKLLMLTNRKTLKHSEDADFMEQRFGVELLDEHHPEE